MEKHPKVIRRKVEIPHYDLGGIIGGLFGGPANALTNQNQFQATLAPTTNVDYTPTIGAASTNALNGMGLFNQNQAQQQGVVNTLGGVVNGTGPNPAQAMLNQATGANVANQAALMAGNRGAGANAGLIARQAAMAGSNAQQQAAGQAASLQAQQSLGALNQQGQVLGQMGTQNLGEQGVNAGLFGTAAGANNAQNNSTIQNYQNMQSLNQQTAQHNADAVNKTEGGFLNGLGGLAGTIAGGMFAGPAGATAGGKLGGSLGGSIGAAHGGMIPDHLRSVHGIYHSNPKLDMVPQADRFAAGGQVPALPAPISTSTATSTATATQDTPVQAKTKANLEHEIGGFANEAYAGGGTVVAPDYRGVQAKIGNWATDGMTDNQMAANKLMADPRTSAPEQELPQNVKGQAAQDYRSGGRVPGQAPVAGDSRKNDIQPAMLSPREIVLPRSITMAPDAPEQAKKFVEAILKKQGHGNSKQHKEFHQALKKAILSRKKKSDG